MKEAFTYMFKDNKFWNKFFILSIFAFIYTFCSTVLTCSIKYDLHVYILSLIVLVCYILIEGHRISVIGALQGKSTELKVLPYVNLKNNFVTGFKYTVAVILFSIPLFSIIAACGYTSVFSMTIGTPIRHTTMYIVTIYSVFMVLTLLFTLISALLINFVIPSALIIFTKTKSVWNFYKFEEMLKIIKSNKKNYIIAVIVYFLAGLIINLICNAVAFLAVTIHIGFISLCIFPAILMVYMFYAVNYFISNIEQNL